MSAVRMDGKALSAKVRGSILAETEELKKKGVTPGLAVIIVGNDPASEIYVRNKERACEQCGFYSEKYALPEETSQEELLGLIAQLNESPQISGILCQMPVPKHISEQAVIDAIDPRKDVDAFHPVNVGKIMVGNFDFVPCTPAGVMELLDALSAKGVKLAIVSNKIDIAVKELSRDYFPGRMQVAVGDDPSRRRKPAPDSVLEAMRQMGVTREETVYVGDSDVDVETARNAGVTCCAVSWGFRSVQCLKDAGATHIAATPKELLATLEAL